jgi:hypothetical protein
MDRTPQLDAVRSRALRDVMPAILIVVAFYALIVLGVRLLS